MSLLKRKKTVEPKPAPVVEKKAPVKKVKAALSDRKSIVSQHISNTSNTDEPEVVIPEESLRIQRIPLGQIRLDPDNSRTRDININKPTLNPFEEGHPRYKETQSEIDEIISMSEHLKDQPLRQLVTLYPQNGKFYVAVGNRRFLGLLVAFGPDHAVNFRVYHKKPVDLALARFQENSQRKDLAVYPQLLEFKQAFECFKQINSGIKISDNKTAQALGTVKSQFSVLKRSTENEDIMSLAEDGIITSKDALKQLVRLSTLQEMIDYLNKKTSEDESAAPVAVKQINQGRGRRKSSVAFPKTITKDLSVMQKLVSGELNSYFTADDFETFDALQEKLKQVADELTTA